MDGNQQREAALHAAGKMRLMRNGNVVILISLVVVIFNAFLALAGALTNPFGFFVRGGTEMVSVFLLLSAIAMAVGGIMYLVGLYGLRNVRPEYRMAVMWEIGLVVLGIVVGVVGKTTFLGQILEAIRSVLSLGIVWLVIQGTKGWVAPEQQEGILGRGTFVWAINGVSIVLSTIYLLIPTGDQGIPMLALGVFLAIFSFAASVYYVLYLGKAAEVLGQMAAATGRE